MRKTVATISSVTATDEIADGRLTMEARDDEASIAVRVPEQTPLSESEPVAELVVHGEDFEADVELTAAAREKLVTTLMEGDDD